MNIVTPCHGAPVSISMYYMGEGYEAVDEIECEHTGCFNAWNPDGTARYIAEDTFL